MSNNRRVKARFKEKKDKKIKEREERDKEKNKKNYIVHKILIIELTVLVD